MRIPCLGLVFITLIFSGIPVFAQETEPEKEPEEKLDKKVKEAFEAYDAEEYYFAIERLKRAFTEVRGREDKSEILFKIAQSYKFTNDYKNAENYFEKAVKLGYKDPVAQLYLADMLKAQGEYEDAIAAYQEYKQLNSSDPRAEIGIESTKKAVEWMDEPSRYQVDNMRDLNSREMDFSAIYAGKRRETNSLIFVSSRDESTGSGEDGWTGQEFMDLYTTSAERKGRSRRRRGADEENMRPSEMKWSTPVPLDEEMINTGDHEGTATIDSRDKTIYYTKCISEKRMKLGCTIYKSDRLGQGWREPEQVIIGNDTTANVGHPNLSPDDNRLYFVSDAFDSKGKHDIFMTTYDRREKTWKEPKNLGSQVNTEGKEYYPFAHDDGYLYFSSDGLPGMGGLDIFRIKLGEDGLPEPDAQAENMKSPINTNWDDFHLVFQPGDDEVGFLSSNRKGGRGSDDIYAVVKTPLVFNLEGVVTSSKTGQPIPQATIKLDGSDGTSTVVNTDKDGYYIFDEEAIQNDVQYTLTFEKQKFLTNTGNVTTIGVPLSSFEYVPSENHYMHNLRLNRELDPIEDPIVLPNVFFDLAKWDLRDESRQALDSVVAILDNNPTIVIELRSHTDYRGDDRSNEVLSQKRADTSVAYLISRGVNPARLVSKGMGENEPFTIPEDYKGYGAGQFEAGTVLTENYINTLSPEKQEVANQINRRTDFKVLRDDYIPEGADAEEGVVAGDIIEEKREEANAPGEIYVMKARESFGSVARDYDMNMVELKRLNNGLRGVRPFEGLQLKVTADGNYEKWDETHHQIQRRGQSFKDIARTLSMDRKELEELNPEIDDDDLQPGLWIRIKK